MTSPGGRSAGPSHLMPKEPGMRRGIYLNSESDEVTNWGGNWM